MKIWIVTWITEGNIPGVDVFGKAEDAMACLRFMVESGKTATVKSVTISQQQPEKQPEDQPEKEQPEEGSGEE